MKRLRIYERYIDKVAEDDRAQDAEVLRHMTIMTLRPNFIILIDAGESDELAADTIASCKAQIYPPSQIIHDKSQIAAIDADNAYLFLLTPGDRLHTHALYQYACRFCAEPRLKMIYCDDDVMRSDGRRTAPFIKPDWSPDYLESFDYIRGTGCYALELAKELLPKSESAYDFVLRFTERTSDIGHLKMVLLHRSEEDHPPPSEIKAKELRALAGRLDRTCRRGRVDRSANATGCYRLHVDLKTSPLVSIVIPTAGLCKNVDGQMQRDLIAQCVRSIVEKSTYRNFEIVIVHNADFDFKRMAEFSSRIRYVLYGESEVNIAKKLNMGAACAAGEILLLMNDDTEVLTSDWIEIMLAHFEKDHVGIVGPRLLYPDLTIQHAGVVCVDGKLIHVNRSTERYDPGYHFSNAAPRNFSAVTGAVTMTKARSFRDVGGYSEDMPLYYNDIDFCYKMRKYGLYNVYEPNVELIHFESLSWTGSDREEHRDVFLDRWGDFMVDPFYNAALLNSDLPRFQFNARPRAF